ncbi:MAG: GNAT family N-acetyltransferase [Pseudomonadota bacterium]
MTGIEIRAPRIDDIPSLVEMLNLPGVRAGTLRLPFGGSQGVRERFVETPPHVHTVVACWDGLCVGHATLTRRFGRQAHCGEVFLFVHDGYWGRGIGTALLGALIDLADKWLGLVRLQLDVNADNARAIALYERAGFEHEGKLRGDVLRDGVLVDSHLMARLRPAPLRMEEGL